MHSSSDPHLASSFVAAAAIACAGIALKTAEDLAGLKALAAGGLLSWSVLRSGKPRTRIVRWLLDRLFESERGTAIFFAGRFVIAVFATLTLVVDLIWAPPLFHGLSCTLTCLLLITQHLISLRTSIGLDGAHQMNTLLLVSFCAASIVPSASVVAAGFLAAQLTLSYLIAGIAKLVSADWRRGLAVHRILWTRTYGLGGNTTVVRLSKRFGVVLCWGIMLLETALPLLFLSRSLIAIGLAVGFLFHASIAALMGLNGFLFAFTAAYPVVWALRQAF
jgi:hypothetical protein